MVIRGNGQIVKEYITTMRGKMFTLIGLMVQIGFLCDILVLT